MDKNFIIAKSTFQKNIYFLVLHPRVGSFSQIIDDINTLSSIEKYNGTIKIDLILMTGDREGRYIEGKITEGKINKSSFTLTKKDPELTQLLEKTYISLSEGDINKVYPISYRNKLKKLKLHGEG